MISKAAKEDQIKKTIEEEIKKKMRESIEKKKVIESDEELSDDGEFFLRDRAQKPTIESFMSVSQQHNARAFGNLVVAASVKPSRVTAFEDAS